MAQNITLLGANYTAVPAVNLPKTGGGTATFYDDTGSVTITQNGTVDVTGIASAVVNVSGGGASNVVSGTFTGTTTGAAMPVTLNYTGSGYPIAAIIYVSEGPYNSSSGTFYSTVQAYALAMWSGVKSRISTPPTYTTSGAENYLASCGVYKSSTSTATRYSRTSTMSGNGFTSSNATASATLAVVFKSKTQMSVFIASTSYGFMAGVEYTYTVIYSS